MTSAFLVGSDLIPFTRKNKRQNNGMGVRCEGCEGDDALGVVLR